ncbi:MAG: histidinol-phosphate transaminase [Calditrichaeota bacterium]|nr:histidinol-phosphate transaminase [Calditrichota bacterium]
MNILEKVRKNIQVLKPYSSARDEFSGTARVLLDANENAFGSAEKGNWNRYPDPYQRLLKEKISVIKNVSVEQIFLGNGSDEAIDLFIRAFCEPGQDSIVLHEPTYGMFRVAADIHDVKVKSFLLNNDFSLDAEKALNAADETTKIIIICSPNNPSANAFDHEQILKVVKNFDGIVMVDEAYIDFCPEKSILHQLNNYENLVVINTFSKAWGLAGLRLGMAFAHSEIIKVLNKIKYPYNISDVTKQLAINAIERIEVMHSMVESILRQREKLVNALSQISIVKEVFHSDTNFLLVRFEKTQELFKYLRDHGIIVRDRSKQPLCEGCLRITVGTSQENELLITAIKDFNHNKNR